MNHLYGAVDERIDERQAQSRFERPPWYSWKEPISYNHSAGNRVDGKSKSLEERVAVLEKKLAALQQSSAGKETLLVTPVKIVDESGSLIAEIVSETKNNAINIYDTKGQSVASLGADGTESGYVVVKNKSGKVAGYLDVERYGARLILNSNKENCGGVAIFGTDSEQAGGGINVIPAKDSGGISLWAQEGSGEIRIEDTDGNEWVINADRIKTTSS